jgi:hypothetical protein
LESERLNPEPEELSALLETFFKHKRVQEYIANFAEGIHARKPWGWRDAPRGQETRRSTIQKIMEVAVGLEPTKTGFADQRLDRFGIATKPC